MINVYNGIDLEAIYNTIVENAVPIFYQLPARKASTENNFPEENGIQIDLTNPAFEARVFTFNMLTLGATMAELNNNYFGFWTMVKQQGVKTFYNSFVDMTINIFYQSEGALNPVQKTAEGKFALRYNLVFSETDPDLNIPDIYFVDDQNRFLVP